MTGLWERLFGRDCKLTMWIEEDELGQDRPIWIGSTRHTVKIPAHLAAHQLIRYRGIGKTRWGKTGDVYVDAWLNRGDDVHTTLWLSRSRALSGTDKKITLDGRTVTLAVPPGCHDRQTIRLKGYGRKPGARESPTLDNPKRGNALVHLRLYDDCIMPRYGSFDQLSTDDMALEGWALNRIDQILQKLGRVDFPEKPLAAEQVADMFNESGWIGVHKLLVDHLRLDKLRITIRTSASLEAPGRCREVVSHTDSGYVISTYEIDIKESFLDHPFSVAAILAHELCHVVCSAVLGEKGPPEGLPRTLHEAATLNNERTVDLLVFMFKVGEFQLRVARDQAFTFGYFHQDVFERIQGIAERRLARLAND